MVRKERAVEFPAEAAAEKAEEAQVSRCGGEAQLLGKLPQGTLEELAPGGQMPGRGDVPAARVGVLVPAAQLEQQLRSRIAGSGKPDVGGAVQVAVPVDQRPRLDLAGHTARLVPQVKIFLHGVTPVFSYLTAISR